MEHLRAAANDAQRRSRRWRERERRRQARASTLVAGGGASSERQRVCHESQMTLTARPNGRRPGAPLGRDEGRQSAGRGAATDVSRKPNDTHQTAKWPPTAFPHALPPAVYTLWSVKLFIQRDDAAGALLAVTLAGAVLVEWAVTLRERTAGERNLDAGQPSRGGRCGR